MADTDSARSHQGASRRRPAMSPSPAGRLRVRLCIAERPEEFAPHVTAQRRLTNLPETLEQMPTAVGVFGGKRRAESAKCKGALSESTEPTTGLLSRRAHRR